MYDTSNKNKGETPMIRKTILAVATVAAVAAATLAPAAAKGKFYRWGFYGGAVLLSAPVIYSCVKYVPTRYGFVRVWDCSY
jgi:hypothetical protein